MVVHGYIIRVIVIIKNNIENVNKWITIYKNVFIITKKCVLIIKNNISIIKNVLLKT